MYIAAYNVILFKYVQKCTSIWGQCSHRINYNYYLYYLLCNNSKSDSVNWAGSKYLGVKSHICFSYGNLGLHREIPNSMPIALLSIARVLDITFCTFQCTTAKFVKLSKVI